MPPLRMLLYFISAWTARVCLSHEHTGTSRHGERHERLKVHRPMDGEQMLALSAEGNVVDLTLPQEGEKPVMRRESREPAGRREKQVDASLTSLEKKDRSDEDLQDLLEAEQAVHQSQTKKAIGFADDLLEELLHAIDHSASTRQQAPNIVMNPEFEEGFGWTKDCPASEYHGHADVTGTACSTRGFWSGAAHGASNTSGNVWSIKSLTDCFKSTRGAVYQDINTTGGVTYELQFYAIDAFLDRKASNQTSTLHVEVQSPPGNTLLDETISLAGSAYEPVEGSWTLVGPYKFKPESSGTRLYFYAGGSACPMLDNIGVHADSSAPASVFTTVAPEASEAAATSTTTVSVSTTSAAPETTKTTTSRPITTTTQVTTAATSASTSRSTTTRRTTASTTRAAPQTPQTSAAAMRASTSAAQPFAGQADEALLAGSAAAATAQANGQKPHQQAMAAADAAARAARAAGRSSAQVALVAAKAAALAVQTAGGSLQQGCVEAGRAASYASVSDALSQQQTATASSNAAFSALQSIGLPADQMTECLALAVKTACRATGSQADTQAECAGSTAMAAAQSAGMTEDQQAEVAGKAVQAAMTLMNDTAAEPEPGQSAQTTTENPEIQVLIKEVEEAKKAAQDAAIAAGMAHVEAEKAKKNAHAMPTTMSSTTTVPSNATFETEVIVTDAPRPVSPTEAPPPTTSTAQTRRACPDTTRAPRGTWAVYNLSATPILHSCLVGSVKERVPDECCTTSGAANMVGATFEELYFSNDYGSCPTLTFAGPLAGSRVKLQCNFDNTITYGEESCGADCSSCASQDIFSPGCYRSSDALPGTAWFFMTAGCDCVDAKAVQPHQFALPPMDQNVKAGDILNVGPEEAAKALNRQRQQLRAFYDEMVKDEQVLTGVVGKLSSGKPIADAIFGMDTGELPEKATKRMLEVAAQDPASAKFAINATVSVMGHALSTLKSGKPLADAIFGGDTSHLIQPHIPQHNNDQELSLPPSSFGGKFPDFRGQPSNKPVVETIRFVGEFNSIIGNNVDQFLQECSAKLKPVECKEARPGSVVVTLSAASWTELHAANALIDKGDFELPSFGKFEKEKESPRDGAKSAKQAFDAAGEMTPEEKKANLLNPDITANDVKVVQSIFDAVHEEEENEAEEGKPARGSAVAASHVPTTEESSASNAIIGVMLLLFGFGCIGFCVYYWSAASKRVKQRLQTATAKRLLKRGKAGDTQLYLTSLEGLQAGEQVTIGKETVTVESVGYTVTMSAALASGFKSGDAVVKVGADTDKLREAASDSAADENGALLKDAMQGDQEVVISSALAVKKGDKVKIGTSDEELTVKAVGKVVTVSPALQAAHAIGSKLRKPGEQTEQTEQTETAEGSPTDREETAGEETAEEKPEDASGQVEE